MNKAEDGIFELAKKLWLENWSLTIKHDIAESPVIILETEHYLEVKTTANETMSLERFGHQKFETDSCNVMYEVLIYHIKAEAKQKYYEERKDD